MVSDQFSSFLEPDNSRAQDLGELNVPSHVETVALRTSAAASSAEQEGQRDGTANGQQCDRSTPFWV
jgi:hypothetical protein